MRPSPTATLSAGVSCPRVMSLCWTHGVSLQRATSPRVLCSTGITPLHHYYDPSDFLTAFSTSSPSRLVRRYCSPSQSTQDLPRSPACCSCMPCSQTPGMPPVATHFAQPVVLSSVQATSSTIPNEILNGAPSLQPFGLRPTTSLSTLSTFVTDRLPKTRYWVRWAPLPRQDFHLLATRRLVAHSPDYS